MHGCQLLHCQTNLNGNRRNISQRNGYWLTCTLYLYMDMDKTDEQWYTTYFSVRVPDLVPLVQNNIVPVVLSEPLYEGGGSLVGKDQHSTAGDNIPDTHIL